MGDFYCGVKKVPKNRRRGTMKECVEVGKVSYWGLNKIDSKIIGLLDNETKKKNSIAKLMPKITGIRGELKKLKLMLENKKTSDKEKTKIKKRIEVLNEEKKKYINQYKAIEKNKKGGSSKRSTKKTKKHSTKRRSKKTKGGSKKRSTKKTTKRKSKKRGSKKRSTKKTTKRKSKKGGLKKRKTKKTTKRKSKKGGSKKRTTKKTIKRKSNKKRITKKKQKGGKKNEDMGSKIDIIPIDEFSCD